MARRLAGGLGGREPENTFTRERPEKGPKGDRCSYCGKHFLLKDLDNASSENIPPDIYEKWGEPKKGASWRGTLICRKCRGLGTPAEEWEKELERQRETNFLETQIRETDDERSAREISIMMAKLAEERRERVERASRAAKRKAEERAEAAEIRKREKKEIVENFSKYGVRAKNEAIEPLILVIDSPKIVSEDDIPDDSNFRLFLASGGKPRDLVFNSISVIAERSEISATTRIRIVNLALFYCQSAKIEEWLIRFEKLRDLLDTPE